MGEACQSGVRIGLKSLVNPISPAGMLDESLASMIDETLRESR
jgi:hypothetical protein